jgi:NAD-dependent SIR2 family protein deacetylase
MSATRRIEPHSELRTVQFIAGGPRIPLELVHARDAGDVVFVVGAGASKGSGLPLFYELTQWVYRKLAGFDPTSSDAPPAERKAYETAAYDVILGLLEQRMDDPPSGATIVRRRVREAVAEELSAARSTGLDRHRDLLTLSLDPRGRPRLVTTNFDTLFERAWPEACGMPLDGLSRSMRHARSQGPYALPQEKCYPTGSLPHLRCYRRPGV